jgi:hypothetical protein
MKAKSELSTRVNTKQYQLRAKQAQYDNPHYQNMIARRQYKLCGLPIRLIDKHQKVAKLLNYRSSDSAVQEDN